MNDFSIEDLPAEDVFNTLGPMVMWDEFLEILPKIESIICHMQSIYAKGDHSNFLCQHIVLGVMSQVERHLSLVPQMIKDSKAAKLVQEEKDVVEGASNV